MNRKDLPKLVVPVFIVGIILLLILPVPSFLLDFLIIINILLALVILLTTLFVKKPLDFSVFPSLLLVATLFRLGLNVASTRLVLGEGFAGDVIQAFGHVAVSGSIIIGAVIFLILIVIQFVVVTKGAERVAEVGARFTLDAMPGKQMAIDADLNAGLITDQEAKERRAAVSAEADFYGAMDGASKFVKGDAIAGILIIIINLVGGIAIGMLQNGLSATDALSKYGILTIGDGLVTQIPALLMAVSTGMIVTRSGAESEMGSSAATQLSQSWNALMIAGVAAIAMGFIPGMPILPFLLVGATLLFTGWRIGRNAARAEADAAQQQALEAAAPTGDTPEDLLEQMRVHALEILLAPDLVDMVSGASDDLLGRVRALRRKIAIDMGIVVPPVRTRDSIDLPPSTYAIRIAGVEAGRGAAPARSVLALGDHLDGLPGTSTVEPVFGLTGKWVPAELRHAAEMTGATVIDRVSVLVTHLQAVIGDNAARLLTREDVKVLTEGVKQVNPAAVEELVPGMLSMAELQRVLQGLLAERVPINDLGRICEALTLRAKVSTDPEGLVESARAALGPALAARHTDAGTLRVIMIDPDARSSRCSRGSGRPSRAARSSSTPTASSRSWAPSATPCARWRTRGSPPSWSAPRSSARPCTCMVAAQSNGLPVLSYQEATAAGSTIETVGVVRAADPIAA
ncbi:flagellar biosynthesis protein FlhA [Curtobacterium flaccumfaciens]|nr:flagellar biosynthesis protein FlhA [Curtobacterium flaccumfaciens]